MKLKDLEEEKWYHLMGTPIEVMTYLSEGLGYSMYIFRDEGKEAAFTAYQGDIAKIFISGMLKGYGCISAMFTLKENQ